ncbi:hypothetical protein SDC9_171308 [bioreactor metagenome]|uniref:Uncharacterized protein n=1 Tax=bioreactor metagenome TaxID=1076179 RepID=A0A645GB99_9ZZZZ
MAAKRHLAFRRKVAQLECIRIHLLHKRRLGVLQLCRNILHEAVFGKRLFFAQQNNSGLVPAEELVGKCVYDE